MVLNLRNHLNKGHLAPTCQQNDKFSPPGLIWQVNMKLSFVIRHKVLELYLYPWGEVKSNVQVNLPVLQVATYYWFDTQCFCLWVAFFNLFLKVFLYFSECEL